LLSEYKGVVDQQSKEVNARRKGRAEGRTEGIIEVARKLLIAGDTIDKVITVTGLSRKDIEGIVIKN
jgi:predicted transposase/invertase (TIGR01784 family)